MPAESDAPASASESFPEDAAEKAPPEPEIPAREPDDPHVKETLLFADHLFLDGDWYRAIHEYRRTLFYVRGRGPDAPRVALAIGEALIRGEQFDAAGRQLDGVATRTADPELRNTALFGAGRAYLLDGRPELAKPRFRLLSEDTEAAMFLREEATWLLAWGHFDAGELEIAKALFESIAKGGGRYSALAQGVVAGIAEKDDLPPVGITAISWNVLFIVAAIVAWVQGQYGPAIVLTVLELGWYGGSIFGALSGAYKYNRDVVRNWRDRLLADYGQGRELPQMDAFQGRHDAKPGTLVRFGGAF
jgi:hypothetical protein